MDQAESRGIGKQHRASLRCKTARAATRIATLLACCAQVNADAVRRARDASAA